MLDILSLGLWSVTLASQKVHAKQMMPPNVLFNRPFSSAGPRHICGVSSAVRDIRDQLLGGATMSIRAVLLLGLLGGCRPAKSQNAVTSPCVNHDGNFTNRGEIKKHKCATLAIKALSEVVQVQFQANTVETRVSADSISGILLPGFRSHFAGLRGGRTPVTVVQ